MKSISKPESDKGVKVSRGQGFKGEVCSLEPWNPRTLPKGVCYGK